MRYLGRVPPQRSGVRSPGLAEWGGLVGAVPCSPHPREGEYSTSPAGHWYPPTTVNQSVSQSDRQVCVVTKLVTCLRTLNTDS